MAIELATSRGVGRVSMPDKEPRFMVDELGKRVYYFRDNRELLAFDFCKKRVGRRATDPLPGFIIIRI